MEHDSLKGLKVRMTVQPAVPTYSTLRRRFLLPPASSPWIADKLWLSFVEPRAYPTELTITGERAIHLFGNSHIYPYTDPNSSSRPDLRLSNEFEELITVSSQDEDRLMVVFQWYPRHSVSRRHGVHGINEYLCPPHTRELAKKNVLDYVRLVPASDLEPMLTELEEKNGFVATRRTTTFHGRSHKRLSQGELTAYEHNDRQNYVLALK